jgi:prephenate dehydrogenase
LCAGPKQNLELLTEIAPFTKRRQVVVDVTSAKSKICKAASKLAFKADFIGGHPFFGSHKSGLTNSAELDIDNKRFCLTPTKRSSEIGVARLSRWLSELGLKVQNIDAAKHDETVAATSHLVQLLAISLGAMMSENKTDQELKDQLALSGPSLQALSRLMASPSPLWIDIVDQNSEAVIAAMEMLQKRLAIMARAVETGDATTLDDEFKLAQRIPGLLP